VVVERFTRKVQSVLVNNCTTSGCHLPGGPQKFQLDRALLHGLANRRTTLKNLNAALALVNRRQPQLSPLLTVPSRVHGGMREPMNSPRQQQAYCQLVDWVTLVSQSQPGGADVAHPMAEYSDVDDRNEQQKLIVDHSVSPVLRTSDAIDARRETDRAAAPGRDAGQPRSKKIQFGARIQPWKPRDPFDAEIFNRGTKRQAFEAGPK
jgi:hypothetical protein